MAPLVGRDLERAADVMRLLVDPLAAPSVDAWRSSVNQALIRLVGADSAGFLLPVADGPVVYSDEHDPAELAKYPELAPPPLSSGKPIFARAVELGVCTLKEVWGDDMHINLNSAYFNEYVAPNRAHDALTAVLPLPKLGPHGMGGIQLWHARPTGPKFGERETALLRVIFTALRAGIDAQLRWDRHRLELLTVLDRLDQATLVCDAFARVLHITPALGEALARDPEGESIIRTMRRIAVEVGGLGAGAAAYEGLPSLGGRDVTTSFASYRIMGALYRSPVASSPPLVLISLERSTPVLRPEGELRELYGFTRAELRVAALLTTSLSSADIARQLHLSAHTIRRHTESILLKARVNSRVELATKLLH